MSPRSSISSRDPPGARTVASSAASSSAPRSRARVPRRTSGAEAAVGRSEVSAAAGMATLRLSGATCTPSRSVYSALGSGAG